MKYLQSDNSKNTYGLYGEVIGPGHLVAIIEFESSADGDKLIRPIAAAPALLALLEETANRLEYLIIRESYPPDASSELLQAVRAAIAEARGEAI